MNTDIKFIDCSFIFKCDCGTETQITTKLPESLFINNFPIKNNYCSNKNCKKLVSTPKGDHIIKNGKLISIYDL